MEVIDLCAADAEYHTDCYANLKNQAFTKESHQVKHVCAKKDSAREAFEKLCEWLESEGENDALHMTQNCRSNSKVQQLGRIKGHP